MRIGARRHMPEGETNKTPDNTAQLPARSDDRLVHAWRHGAVPLPHHFMVASSVS